MNKKEILEAGALAIKNIAVIEQAYDLIANEIEDKIMIKMEKLIYKKLPNSEWESDLSGSDDECAKEAWISKSNWQDEDGNFLAKFSMWEELPKKGGSNWYITEMCGLGEVETGFAWRAKYDQRCLGLDKKKWKLFADKKNRECPKLEKIGFVYNADEGTWFLPIRIDVDKLAEAWQNEELDDYLSGVVDGCMHLIIKAMPVFDSILKEAKVS